jgi:lysophospholipid acyltransferase (LPLAT)-like uncharacterized protein
MASRRPLHSFWIWFEALILWLVAYVLLATIRMKVLHQERLFEARQAGKPILFAFWHGRQLALFKANPERRLVVLASLSRDGALQTQVCKRFGVLSVRGSSSRRGLSAMLRLGKMLATGVSVGLAVDGPRGPLFVAKRGILALARARGCPVVPMTVGFRRKLELRRTWDRFQIPVPFTRATVAYGVPLWVPSDIDASSLEEMAARLTNDLRSLTAEVDGASLAG